MRQQQRSITIKQGNQNSFYVRLFLNMQLYYLASLQVIKYVNKVLWSVFILAYMTLVYLWRQIAQVKR